MADEILYEKIDPAIVVVTLNRPEKRNAINMVMALALEAAVQRSEADGDVRVVILTSSNDRVFCAGADLAAVTAGEKMTTADGGFAGFVYHPRKKPWIAAVRGAALAGGLEMALACDMIVASPDAKFGLPEVKWSLVAGAGGVSRLPRAIPRAIAIEMVTTADPIDAGRAYELGLINLVAPAGEEVAEALKIAHRIAANAPLAVVAALEIVREATEISDAEGRARAEAALAGLRHTEDFKEGPRAFVEKRAPVWKGK